MKVNITKHQEEILNKIFSIDPNKKKVKQKSKETMCSKFDRPIKECSFVELSDSRYESSYTKSVHYQKMCEECNEIIFCTGVPNNK